jgi:hypothetical protein
MLKITANLWSLALFAAVACTAAFVNADTPAGAESHLFHNEDCTNFFYAEYDPRDPHGGAAVDAYVDRVAAGGVTAFLCNTNAERTNYASDVWEPLWTGYDPDGPDDQPYLAGIGNSDNTDVTSWRRLVDGMLALHRQRIDYPARVIARCRHHGIEPWISLRMNDVHCQDLERHPIHSDFWRNNPQLRRQGYDGNYSRALDYGRSEVRDHYMKLIDETLDRYDIDGLELDFMREPYLFSRGKEDEGRAILTAWLAEVRERTRKAAARRGHQIRLGIRTPSRPEVSLQFGLDPVEWARRGLVDLIVVSPRWATTEFAMPIRKWQRLLDGTGVVLLGGLEVLVRPYRAADQRGVAPEEAIGAASQVLHDGADGVYLFNYFPNGSATGNVSGWWSNDVYRQSLRAMAAPSELVKQPRRHVVTFSDVNHPDGDEGWGKAGKTQLPAVGPDVVLTLPTGPRAPGDWQAELTLRLESSPAKPPAVRVNGSAAAVSVSSADPRGEPAGIRYTVPVTALRDDAANEITAT